MKVLKREAWFAIFFLLSWLGMMISIVGGMDAWQYWWIKSGYSGYSLKTMKVSSVKSWTRLHGVEWVGLYGVIDGRSVHGKIQINPRTRENAYLQSVQPGELADFYCHGPITQDNQGIRLIEASFIHTPPPRIWWVPVVSSVAAVFFGLFLFEVHRRRSLEKRIHKEERARKRKERNRRRRR